MSIQTNILLATKSCVDGLSLSLAGNLLTSFIKKWPTREQGVEPDAGLYIYVSADGKTTEPFAMGTDGVTPINNVKYPIRVALVCQNNGDQVGGLTDYGTIQEAIANVFKNKAPFTLVAQVFDANVVDAPFLDRATMPLGYDVIEQEIRVDTAE
jgi:hypothetical protein